MSGRNKRATWRSLGTLCRELDWSLRRLIAQLQGGWPYRTIPPGHAINWNDPYDWHGLSIERSEVTLSGRVPVPEGMIGLGNLTVGLELRASPDAPADAEAPSPSVTPPVAPAVSPAPLPSAPRKPLTGKELRECILAIKEERPDDPPSRDDLREEVENRLNWPVGRDRVDKVRKKVAPQWVNPKGRPRKPAK